MCEFTCSLSLDFGKFFEFSIKKRNFKAKRLNENGEFFQITGKKKVKKILVIVVKCTVLHIGRLDDRSSYALRNLTLPCFEFVRNIGAFTGQSYTCNVIHGDYFEYVRLLR
ncbi:hypothetical protein Tcan_00290 [Toxocara canis]|uniref:Uncharacterized protein n=1 Tax=Toxocara canis TaxID=6265 RepID=A0A0B2UXL5_TOXCA|nr:hypothetical protein Tcan_00290 [Toxocara canis]